MSKILATLIAGLFAVGAYAADPAKKDDKAAAKPAAPAAASAATPAATPAAAAAPKKDKAPAAK